MSEASKAPSPKASAPSHKSNCTCAVCADLSSGSTISPNKAGGSSQAESSSRAHDRSVASNAAGLNSECVSGAPRSSQDATAASGTCTCIAIDGGKGSDSGHKKGGKGGKGGKGKSKKDISEGGTKAMSRPRPICVGEARSMLDEECDEGIDSMDEPSGPTAVVSAEEEPCDQLLKKEHLPPQPYFPAPGDSDKPAPGENMGPLSMWATGRPDWTPLAGLTGTRPIVDRHSISRFSINEWRQHNLETFQKAAGDSQMANLVDFNARSCIAQTLSVAPKNQRDVTTRIQQRVMDVKRWLPEIAKSHQAIWHEIQNLMTEEDRLRRILCAIDKIMHIIGECIEIRSTRFDTELTRDEVELELCKELALANEVRQLVTRTKDQIQQQLDTSRAAKHRLEQDISDKRKAIKIDTENINYTVHSPLIMFHPGAVRFMNNQSTPESWEIGSRENLCLSENERAKICTLRALIETVVVDSARDLTAQKGRVDDALVKSVDLNVALSADLEDQLKRILKNIVEVEKLISDLKDSIRKFDFPLKKAQTRLHNREERPRVENTRDCPQYGLMDEAKAITEQVTALMAQLCQAEDALMALVSTRRQLEREIQAKRKNVYVDRDRLQRLRQHYPLAETLMARAFSQCLPCR